MGDARRSGAGELGWLRGAAIAVLVGLLVGVLVNLEAGRLRALDLLLSGGLGLLVFVYARLLSALVEPRMRKLSGPRRAAALAILLALSGALAWSSLWLSLAWWGRVDGTVGSVAFWAPLLVAALVAMLAGFLFTGYERLRRELTDQISRRQAAEYAERELNLAASMQRRLLPPLKIEAGRYRVAAANRAARWVAGDLYDVFTRADGGLGLAVGDVAGKGVGVSLIMASVKAMLPLVAARGPVEAALEELNRMLLKDLGPREFVALALASYDPASGAFRLANAGLPDPYLLHGDTATPIGVPGQRLPLGLRRDLDYQAVEGRLRPGDRLLLLTDGMPEARGPEGEPLGYPAFQAMLPRGAAAPEVWLQRLFDSVAARTGERLEDDWTALLLERAPS